MRRIFYVKKSSHNANAYETLLYFLVYVAEIGILMWVVERLGVLL